MNTKIQVLNSVDLENISGGMYKSFESCGVSSSSCGDSSRLQAAQKLFLNSNLHKYQITLMQFGTVFTRFFI